jgi:hypothetical protein
VDDCPLWAGTAEEVALYHQRQLRRWIETERPEDYVYAFTEMLVLEFEAENEITHAAEEKPFVFPGERKKDVQHASTEAGEAFTAFVRFMFKQVGPKKIVGQGLRK